MLFEQLGIKDLDRLFSPYTFRWRNTERSCVLILADKHIRDLPDASVESEDGRRLVIDVPFGEPGHRSRDGVGRLQQFRQACPDGTRTLVWVPNYFSQDALRHLGLLVVLEHSLAGERFGGYASHLNPQDKLAPRTLLEDQCSELRQRVRHHLEAAYGLDALLEQRLARVTAAAPALGVALRGYRRAQVAGDAPTATPCSPGWLGTRRRRARRRTR